MLVVTNQCSETVLVAVAYTDRDTHRWTSRGWWRIEPFDDIVIFDSSVELPADVHLHARTTDGRALTSAGGPGRPFRVRDERFTLRSADRRVGSDAPFFELLDVTMNTKEERRCRHRVVTHEMARAEAALDGMIGLDSVKELVLRQRAWMQVQIKRRQLVHLRPPPIRLHMAFKGKPGTGKTTVARIFGDIYKGLGLLKDGHLVEVDGRGLIAAFVGQTAARTNEVIESAVGGVLFIDEAYALYQRDTPQDFGREAIATLVKGMEERKHELAVILAGYPAEIDEMMTSNRGLLSRIQTQIEFPDYSPQQLFSIFDILVRRVGAHLTSDCEETLRRLLVKLCETRDPHFGNARMVETLFQAMDEARSVRVVQAGMDYVSEAFKREDIPSHLVDWLGARNAASSGLVDVGHRMTDSRSR